MKILIAPQFGLGDALMSTPAIRILKEEIEESHITVFTIKKEIRDIFYYNPFVDNIIYYPMLKKGWGLSFLYLIKNLFHTYDVTINFFPSNRMEYNLFSVLTGSKLRLGHRYLDQNMVQLNFLKNRLIKEDSAIHCVKENVKLLTLLGIQVNYIPDMVVRLKDDELNWVDEFISRYEGIFVGVHAGSSNQDGHYRKRWGKERFLRVINHFKDFSFFLFGTDEESEENGFLLKNSIHGNVVPIINRPIRQIASLISKMDIFLTSDSGLMHLASALRVPIIAIFGPTDPHRVHPWGADYKIIRINMECSPCFYYSPRPLRCSINERYRCLDIPHDIIIDAIHDFIPESKLQF